MKNVLSRLLIAPLLLGGWLYGQGCCEPTAPEVSTTGQVVFTTGNSVRVTGAVLKDGGSAILQQGVVWGTTPGVDLNANVKNTRLGGIIKADIENLMSGATYFVRAFAANAVDTAFGEEMSFTVDSFMTDFDGNAYTYRDFCGVKWTTANLAVKHYNNGVAIPNVQSNTDWSNLSSGGWCHHSNDAENEAVYGLLYNFYAVSDSNGLAPAGWRIPTEADWMALRNCYGVDSVAGGYLKSNEMYWRQPNVGATDTSAFVGRPGGMRLSWGGFFRLGTNGHFWSTTVPFPGLVRYFALDYDNAGLGPAASGLRDGFSVRLVRE